MILLQSPEPAINVESFDLYSTFFDVSQRALSTAVAEPGFVEQIDYWLCGRPGEGCRIS